MSTPTPKPDLASLRIDRAAPETPRRGLPAWIIAIVIILGALAVAIPLALRHRAPRVETGTAIVERAPAGASTVLAASGYVVARTKAAVSAKTAGRLEELNVEEGSRVRQGDVIARLENEALQAEVSAALASLSQAQSAVQRAQADADLARVELQRQQRLMEAQLGTQSSLDTARAQSDARAAALAEARQAVTGAQARLTQARVGLENANVRAPFSGVVLRKEAEVGEYVAPSVASGSLTRGAIVTMADLTSLEVEADVAEGNVAKLSDGMPAQAELDAVPDRRYRAKLRQVMPTADRQKATVQVKVALLDADERVKPEMSAKLTFLSAEPDAAAMAAPPVVTAPARAIVTSPSGAFAWRVEGERVGRVDVTLGERRGERIVIVSGLSGGESLVLDPPAHLSAGDKVQVSDE